MIMQMIFKHNLYGFSLFFHCNIITYQKSVRCTKYQYESVSVLQLNVQWQLAL